jgi:hypothetical protein
MKRIKPAPLEHLNEDQFGKVYHVSNHRNRASIKEHGLVPGGDMAKDESGKPKQYGDMNWVFKNKQAAHTMSAGNWGIGHNDVWEIDAHPHEVEEDPHPGWESMPDIQQARGVLRGKVDPSRMRRL